MHAERRVLLSRLQEALGVNGIELKKKRLKKNVRKDE